MYWTLFFLLFTFESVLAKPISISAENNSNLDFGNLTPGDSSRIVPPGTSENSQNASFIVKGDKNRAYSIILPSSVTISINGQGSNPLILSSFQSFPSEGANGLLDARGQQKIYLGATIQSIPFNQPAGSYSGTFVVEVIY